MLGSTLLRDVPDAGKLDGCLIIMSLGQSKVRRDKSWKFRSAKLRFVRISSNSSQDLKFSALFFYILRM